MTVKPKPHKADKSGIKKAAKILIAQELVFNLLASEAWDTDDEIAVSIAQNECLKIADRIFLGWERYTRQGFSAILAQVVKERKDLQGITP